MPFEDTPPSIAEPRPEAIIWRYVSLWKLIDLFESRALWFSRLTELGDEWEGVPIYRAKAGDPEEFKAAQHNIRFVLYASCWSEFPVDSAAMWGLFGNAESVAVRTTAGRLKDSLAESTLTLYWGRVRYIQYTRWRKGTETQRYDLTTPAFRKRRSFKYEQEIRAVALSPSPWPDLFHAPPTTPRGVRVPVPVEKLVESIYVSPRAAKPFEATVRAIVHRYGLPVKVHRSELDQPALF